MTSFLDKLKGRVEAEDDKSKPKQEKKIKDFSQLDVDIFQTEDTIFIIAQISGVEIKDLSITLGDENDSITIQGGKELPPEFKVFKEKGEGKYLRQECLWGEFYRQIILPQEINVNEVSAKTEKGVLIITLPLLRIQPKGKKKIEIVEEEALPQVQSQTQPQAQTQPVV
jgi:HSP20 family protein